jgi:hypothetical protein
MKKAALLGVLLSTTFLGCNDRPAHRHRHDRDRPVRAPLRGPDMFEANNDRDRPSRIAVGEAQVHTIFPEEDEDWIRCRTPRPGRYDIAFTHVTVGLRADVWLHRRGRRDDPDRAASWRVRRPAAFQVRVPPGTLFMELRIRAEDDDERGWYRLTIRRD